MLSRWLGGSGLALGRALAVVAAVLAVLLGARRAGRLAERLEMMEKAHDAQRRMLEAAARRPRSRDDLAQRLRDGRF
ncbi:hypothetical protein [Roseospira visakhapatnamensis]|uniref:Uncharacterized protein n=1 Tax=Roseospira visakhapatnamensis TaxID=390880 RepID=A0A7W6RFP5_9PROT|nr:hypothetical protein [Roseospira visakhapatnamensis]MBB4267592.1 hypothetical protein [Roseospira visakhapatnamensis]